MNDDLPAANVPGTGWRISSTSGRKYFRIEKGSSEFNAWMQFYRDRGKRDLANFITTVANHTFVLGPSIAEFGASQIAYLNQLQSGSKS